MKLWPAITLGGAKNIAREALRVYAHKRRRLTTHLTLEEDYELFVTSQRTVTRNLEVAPFSWQSGNSDPLDGKKFV